MRCLAIALGLLSVASSSVACSGVIGEPGASPRDPTQPPPPKKPDPTDPMMPTPIDRSFHCDPTVAVSATPLRRLSAVEYQNTLRDLFAGDASFDVDSVAASALDRQPVDDAGLSFKSFDARLSENHVQSFFDIADALAVAASSNAAHRAALAGSCAASGAPSASCVDQFLDDFALRAFRRPLTTEEKDRYRALIDGVRALDEVYFALFFSVLMAPDFLYRVEVNGAPLDPSENQLALDPYELASRLAYHFWQTMPDAELFAAAGDGSLLTDEGYLAQATRVFEDARTRATIRGFYGEWFRLRKLASFPDTAAFNAFAEGTGIGEPGDEALAAMAEEIEAMTDHFTWDVEGSFRDLLLSDLSFTQSPQLARLYGVEPWDGRSELPHLPSAERSGLLTRASFLISGTNTTHPIHRGATVRKNLLCDVLPQPDPNSLPPGSLVPPPVDASQTTRERFANKVKNEPCATCHSQMNPIGYVLERYDALGRFRSDEHVLDPATGAELSVLPIDSSSAPRIVPNDDTVIDSGSELSALVADSGKVEPCFAREYFRFSYGREETPDDNCTLEPIRSALAGEASLRKALFSLATAPSFRTRRVE